MIAPLAVLPTIIKFPTLPGTPSGFADGQKITLREWYQRSLWPEIKDLQAERSLREDRVALNRWEDCTDDPDIRTVNRETLEGFRDKLLLRSCSEHTCNKYWRELKSIFRDATEEGVIPKVPKIAKRFGSLIRIRRPKVHKPLITLEEVDRLYAACERATYPVGEQTALLWRVALVLFFTYGARTIDIIGLDWSNVLWSDRLIKFQAMKTSKVQGLPMTPAVEAHLRLIEQPTGRILAGFKTTGHRAKKTGKWKPGYYSTWRSELCPVLGREFPFKLFRESMVTRYNAIEDKLGSWIAGHFVPGVSAQSYDVPTERIRAAIESAPVPKSFLRIA